MSLNRIVLAIAFGTMSVTATADNADFLSVCTKSWMAHSEQAKDKVDYKNFGEKYCGCAATQPLDSQDAIKKAIQVCMSRTLLHDAMDSLEEDVGLKEAKDSDVSEYCMDRWTLIAAGQSAEAQSAASAYCECAKPKLMDLIKGSDNMTDKQYDEQIDTIAGACSGNVQQQAPEASSSPAPAQAAPAS